MHVYVGKCVCGCVYFCKLKVYPVKIKALQSEWINNSIYYFYQTTTSLPVLTTISTSLRTVVRNVDLKSVDQSDWLVFETALGGRNDSNEVMIFYLISLYFRSCSRCLWCSFSSIAHKLLAYICQYVEEPSL